MDRLVAWLKKMSRYLWGKRSELKDMSEADILLAKVVLDIHRKRSQSICINVPLFDLCQIHPIDRENSIRATTNRINILTDHKEELLQAKTLSREYLQNYLPSVSAIKVVADGKGEYIAYEGNGRLVALQKVFSPIDNIHIEVEEYQFKNEAKVIERMNKIRKLHNLL